MCALTTSLKARRKGMELKMKYLKKLELSDEMFTEKEKKKIEKYYEKGNNYYNDIKKADN